MHKTRAAISFGLLLAACGPDSILVESGKTHTCNLQKATKALEADATNETLQKEVVEHAERLKAVIDTAESGDRDKLQAAIAEAAAKGCG